MRIAYLTHSMNPRTGVGAFSTTLIDGVRARMFHVRTTVLTSEDLLRPPKWRMVMHWRAIRRVLRDADIVHALDGFPYGVIAALALVGTTTPLIITAIGTGAVQKLRHPLWSPLMRWAYRRARIVTAPSAYTARTIEAAVHGIYVEIINHGVDTSFWGATRSDATLRLEPPYILSVGSYKRRKGHHIALRAFARIAAAFPRVRFVLAGDVGQGETYARELGTIIDECGIRDRVILMNSLSREKLRDLYQRAELFLLLPQNDGGDVEGFGLVFLEAAAAGCPSVAGKGSGADDAIRDGESGFLVDAHDPEVVAGALRRIMTERDVRDRMKVHARHFAETLSWQHQLTHYTTLYERF